MAKTKKKYSDFFESAGEVMPQDKFKRAVERGEQVVAFLHLAEARKKMGLRQVDVEGYTQDEISKIENRSDIKLSTLIDYMKSIGMGIKIVGIPQNDDEEEFEILTAKAK
ncbi:MAG: helix-turn-helix transcriptional regulator [Bdellovibrionales bacterium]|nr:helix-turn-helix transcriptional regulator [Bdellovibrionales bacterium]